MEGGVEGQLDVHACRAITLGIRQHCHLLRARLAGSNGHLSETVGAIPFGQVRWCLRRRLSSPRAEHGAFEENSHWVHLVQPWCVCVGTATRGRARESVGWHAMGVFWVTKSWIGFQ